MASSFNDTVRTLFKHGGVLFFGVFLELGISFLAKLLIARVLGPVDYGVVSIGITTTAIVSTVALLGLNRGIGRYLPRFEDPVHRRGILVSAFEVAFPLSVLAGVGVVLAAPVLANELFDNPALVPILRVFGLAIPLATAMKFSVGAVQGYKQSLPKVYITNITLPVVRFVGVVVLLSLGFRAIGVAWAYAGSYAAAATVGLYFLVRRTPLFDRGIETVRMRRELLTFSTPLVISTAMTLVLSDIDTLMLGVLGRTGAVGIYNVVYPLAELLTVTVASFGFVFMPVISELHQKEKTEATVRLYRLVTKWILFATLPLFALFALFPERAILLTFGVEYVVGGRALAVLSIAFFTHSVAGPNANALTSFGHTRLIMYDNTLVAAVNVGLNLLLIPRYSYFGAAVATAVSYVLLNLLYSAQLYRVAGVHPLDSSVLRPGVVATVLFAAYYGVVRTVLPPSLLVFVVSFAVLLAVYGVAFVRFGVESEEVMLVLSFEERFGVELGPLKSLARTMRR